jgi:hypothetical protein
MVVSRLVMAAILGALLGAAALAPAAERSETPPLHPKARAAFVRLLKAEAVEDPLLNLRGHPGDFREIMRDPLAIRAFVELTKSGTPAGRAYGLAGLWWKSGEQFRVAAARMEEEANTFVNIMVGDFGQPVPMPEIVDRIRRGAFDP